MLGVIAPVIVGIRSVTLWFLVIEIGVNSAFIRQYDVGATIQISFIIFGEMILGPVTVIHLQSYIGPVRSIIIIQSKVFAVHPDLNGGNIGRRYSRKSEQHTAGQLKVRILAVYVDCINIFPGLIAWEVHSIVHWCKFR